MFETNGPKLLYQWNEILHNVARQNSSFLCIIQNKIVLNCNFANFRNTPLTEDMFAS